MSTTYASFAGPAAQQVLRGLNMAGLDIVSRARSPHGSDCGDCGPTIGHCRCLRVMRVRCHGGGTGKSSDWLLIFGDCQEGPAVRLQGPYSHDTPLSYGGGFWRRVEV